MAKIPSFAKVHAYGGGVNDSFGVAVEEHYEMFDVYLVYPGTGYRLPMMCVCGYEVKQQIASMLGKMYEDSDVEQLNITWTYKKEEEK